MESRSKGLVEGGGMTHSRARNRASVVEPQVEGEMLKLILRREAGLNAKSFEGPMTKVKAFS